MIDLHLHTLLSDGVLIPSELIKRAREKGYKGMAITDHVDSSNLESVIENTLKVVADYKGDKELKVLAGVEITHVPVGRIAPMIEKTRQLGAHLVVVHGESPVEPVQVGTNREAIEAKCDILAHPGLISDEDCKLAKENGVYLELTSRRGHSLTNGHVAAMAKKHGVKLILNSDSHCPGDLIDDEMAKKVVLGAGLNADDYKTIKRNSEELLEKLYK